MPVSLTAARRRRVLGLGLLVLLLDPPVALADPDPEACRVVRLADVGWTDVTATTAVVSNVLRDLGYEPRVTMLSVPVTFEALAAGDIDVFLGHWLPSQRAMIAPYLTAGHIERVAVNLRGAKYTLAVPDYLHEAGLRDFRDIARFRQALGGMLHGIEAGNEANELLLKMIREGSVGLAGFRVVESSEQGMLAAVERAVRARQPIVFLGWAPHPMNTRVPMRYLSGGDAWFGPDFGGATVHTVTRRDLRQTCPNLGRLLAQTAFTVDEENAWMEAMLIDRQDGLATARRWVHAHRARVATWTADVEPLSRPAATASDRGRWATSGFTTLVQRRRLPLGDIATTIVARARSSAATEFALLTTAIDRAVSLVHRACSAVPAPLLIGAAATAAWYRRRSKRLALFVVGALLLIVNLGFWAATVETLALVLVSATAATVLGVPAGVLMSRHRSVETTLRPVLDLMQTLPTFVYLTPTIVLFGLGVVPGVVATVIFAMPAPIRMTLLGLRGVPRALVDAGDAFGATPWQRLWMIELPEAAPTIYAGISQALLLSLSMVVIAALVGAGGLGAPVVRALNTVQVGAGIEAGLAIVLLAIILDRLARPADHGRVR